MLMKMYTGVLRPIMGYKQAGHASIEFNRGEVKGDVYNSPIYCSGNCSPNSRFFEIPAVILSLQEVNSDTNTYIPLRSLHHYQSLGVNNYTPKEISLEEDFTPPNYFNLHIKSLSQNRADITWAIDPAHQIEAISFFVLGFTDL